MTNDTLALAHLYARLIDDRQFGELTRVFAPEIRIAGPGYTMNGLAEVLAGMEVLRQYDRTFHLVGNQLGEWQDERTWLGETYCMASHVYLREGAEWKFDMAIRYQDRVERRAEGLRFVERELRVAFTTDLPLSLVR